MRNIEDLEHFVLAEGETLILRCKHRLPNEQLAYMRESIERYLPGRPVLVLPPEIEVCAGKLEVFGVDMDSEEDSAAATEALRRNNIQQAYNNGRLIYVRDKDGEIFVAQRAAYSHTIDFDANAYGLTRKEVEL